MEVILASASERRRDLLGRLFEKFEVIVSDFDEDRIEFNGDVGEYVKKISLEKALNVKNKFLNLQDKIIISADTVVALDGKVLGKPIDEEDAFRMLKYLQGRSHFVYTGITVVNTKTGQIKNESLSTEVIFSKISDNEIWEYIKTGEPLDKAGAYGIQERGGIFVEQIRGCYYNVVGLPLNKLKHMMDEIT